MIKAIIFDLNRVLVEPKVGACDSEYRKLLGVEKKDFWKAAQKHFMDYQLDKTDHLAFMENVLRDLNLDIRLAETAKRLHEQNIGLVEGIAELLSTLRKRYRLILLAGDGKDSIDWKLDNFNLRHYFNSIHATCYEGISKDDPAIYKRVLKREGLRPAEAVFIDDLAAHIKAAASVGIRGIIFRDVTQAQGELARLH